MKLLPFIIFCCIVFVLSANVMTFFWEGEFISKKTEEKYLRNLSKMEPTNSRQFYTNNAGDSLSYIVENTFSIICPFSEWHIADVGLIRRGSLLSNKLDSISAKFVEPENKLK